jgi:hypothetical protein
MRYVVEIFLGIVNSKVKAIYRCQTQAILVMDNIFPRKTQMHLYALTRIQ